MSDMRYKAVLMSVVLGLVGVSPAQAEPVDFNADIRPILADRCFHCHGPDTSKNKADLRLDLEDHAKEFAISPGDVSDSDLITRILSTDPEEHMPPPDSGKKRLTSEETALFVQWIEEGAKWDTHWAWTPPTRPEPIDNVNAQNPIDSFVRARVLDAGLTPAPEAPRETLIRRASFDLTGIPPTLEEIDAFVNDKSDKAFEKVLDRLLASPHYGERMAIDWLDGARYADSNGFQNDFGRDMHPWRDWVIKAFNDNMPFDQFTVEQIAGDLLPNATDEQRIATGFNRNHRSNTEGGSIEEEWRIENIVDRVETTGTMFLGLTIGCARCHDHKYDPITQKDFYRFFAFFNSTADRGFYEETRGNTGPQVTLSTGETSARLTRYDERIAVAEEDLKKEKKSVGSEHARWRSELIGGKYKIPKGDPAFHLPLQGDVKPLNAESEQAILWRTGLTGNAPIFAGTDDSFINAGQSFSFDRATPFTIAVWVRSEGAATIFSSTDDTEAKRGVDFQILGDGKIQANFVSTAGSNAMRVESKANLTLNEWAHVGITYDGSGSKDGALLYLNGVLVDIISNVDNLTETITTTSPLLIGKGSPSGPLKGQLTDFRAFDKALDSGTMSDLMKGTLASLLPNKVSADEKTALEKIKEFRTTLLVADAQEELDKNNRARFDYVARNVPTVMVLEELETPRPTYRLMRGVYDAPDTTETLDPGVPSFLSPMPADYPQNRLGLAQWLVNPENPLTARVTVNRLWQKMFGDGLVRTSENFGTQSEVPRYPMLLDWLATEFVRLDWDLKAMQKTIMMSETYRQDSTITEESIQRDPENKLIARGPRFRLQSELVRDNALAVSGLLSEKIGGPAVKPYQPAGLWEELAGGASQGPYEIDKGDDLYRRSLYTFRKRTVPHSTMSTFDAPSFEVCYVRRARTNTPLQALALLNDITYVEAARHLAERMMTEGGNSPNQRIEHGFRLVTGRHPTPRELAVLSNGYTEYAKQYAANSDEAMQYLTHGESELNEKLNVGELAAYATLASVMLNLDEAITKE